MLHPAKKYSQQGQLLVNSLYWCIVVFFSSIFKVSLQFTPTVNLQSHWDIAGTFERVPSYFNPSSTADCELAKFINHQSNPSCLSPSPFFFFRSPILVSSSVPCRIVFATQDVTVAVGFPFLNYSSYFTLLCPCDDLTVYICMLFQTYYLHYFCLWVRLLVVMAISLSLKFAHILWRLK